MFREKDSGDLDRTEEIGLDVFLERYIRQKQCEKREKGTLICDVRKCVIEIY